MNFIQDGTGKGYLAQVSSANRLLTETINETSFISRGRAGAGFNVNTEFVSITVGTETPLFYLKNNESSDVVLVAWFIGTGIAGGTPTEHGLVRVYTNPTGVSGGLTVPVTNRRVGDGRTFSFDAKKQSAGTPLLATLPTTPVLYQTQTPQSRVFGEVYVTLPRAQSVVVTYQANGGQTINIYTGFSGYVED